MAGKERQSLHRIAYKGQGPNAEPTSCIVLPGWVLSNLSLSLTLWRWQG